MKISVCTYNVGGWVDGRRSGLYPEELSTRTMGWQKFLSDFDPDFLLMEEASYYLDAAHTMLPYDTLFKERYPYTARPVTGQKWTDAVLICSKNPIDNVIARNYASGSGRPFVTFKTELKGRALKVAVAHLTIESDSEGIRQKDLAELADLMGKGELDIIVGDFNTYAIGEFDVFRTVAHLANHGDKGDFETWPHTSGNWNRCIDNVIVRNNLSVENVRLGTEVLSDHMPLMAEIVL